MQEHGLRDAQQQAAISVWSSMRTLQTDTENPRNTEVVLQSARQALDAAWYCYQSNVGGILELLNAESIVSSSEQQWIQAQLGLVAGGWVPRLALVCERISLRYLANHHLTLMIGTH